MGNWGVKLNSIIKNQIESPVGHLIRLHSINKTDGKNFVQWNNFQKIQRILVRIVNIPIGFQKWFLIEETE